MKEIMYRSKCLAKQTTIDLWQLMIDEIRSAPGGIASLGYADVKAFKAHVLLQVVRDTEYYEALFEEDLCPLCMYDSCNDFNSDCDHCPLCQTGNTCNNADSVYRCAHNAIKKRDDEAFIAAAERLIAIVKEW